VSKTIVTSVLALGMCVSPALFSQERDSVREAQQALKDKGFDPGPVDGLSGPKTQAAVRQYQAKQNLTVDGRLGQQTLDSLGVKHGKAGTKFDEAGSNIKNSYSTGGKQVGEGGKALGSDIKHGEVVDGAKTFGKDVGHGVAKMGEGTGHAAANTAKGVKKAVTGNKSEEK
jgi:peptidoglycan hydrolase-like protein with peptidoglycan-binding domain